MANYTELTSCRVSKEEDLVDILNLGHQKLTGVFPRPEDEVGTIANYPGDNFQRFFKIAGKDCQDDHYQDSFYMHLHGK